MRFAWRKVWYRCSPNSLVWSTSHFLSTYLFSSFLQFLLELVPQVVEYSELPPGSYLLPVQLMGYTSFSLSALCSDIPSAEVIPLSRPETSPCLTRPYFFPAGVSTHWNSAQVLLSPICLPREFPESRNFVSLRLTSPGPQLCFPKANTPHLLDESLLSMKYGFGIFWEIRIFCFDAEIQKI